MKRNSNKIDYVVKKVCMKFLCNKTDNICTSSMRCKYHCKSSGHTHCAHSKCDKVDNLKESFCGEHHKETKTFWSNFFNLYFLT